jgi:hypothetical protein
MGTGDVVNLLLVIIGILSAAALFLWLLLRQWRPVLENRPRPGNVQERMTRQPSTPDEQAEPTELSEPVMTYRSPPAQEPRATVVAGEQGPPYSVANEHKAAST